MELPLPKVDVRILQIPRTIPSNRSEVQRGLNLGRTILVPPYYILYTKMRLYIGELSCKLTRPCDNNNGNKFNADHIYARFIGIGSYVETVASRPRAAKGSKKFCYGAHFEGKIKIDYNFRKLL